MTARFLPFLMGATWLLAGCQESGAPVTDAPPPGKEVVGGETLVRQDARSPSSGIIAFSEFMVVSAGPEEQRHQWVELANRGEGTVRLDHWEVELEQPGQSAVILHGPVGVEIEQGGVVAYWLAGSGLILDKKPCADECPLPASGAVLRLVASGDVLDSVGYGQAGEPGPSIAPEPGHSLALLPFCGDDVCSEQFVEERWSSFQWGGNEDGYCFPPDCTELGKGDGVFSGVYDAFGNEGTPGSRNPWVRFDSCGDGQYGLGFGCPCSHGSDCDTGLCVPTPDGNECSMPCENDCPAAPWVCANEPKYAGEGTDFFFLCLYAHSHLCDPCNETTDCIDTDQVLDADRPDVCVTTGPSGSFCAHLCQDAEDCPPGYACLENTTSDTTIVLACVPEEGECECSKHASAAGDSTACTIENEFGKCEGIRKCAAGAGLSDCSAGIPAPETCAPGLDGLPVDENCNGSVDEPADKGDGAAFEKGYIECYYDADGDGFGSNAPDNMLLMCECPPDSGMVSEKGDCEDGDAGIHPPTPDQPMPELCDGKDNNCDGTVDETFADTDLDGAADCIDGDDDDDLVPDDADNCPLFKNPGQEDFPDQDGIGNPCDQDDDDDGYLDEEDCGPESATVNPGAIEQCNEKDDNCDGQVDEGYADQDLDGLLDECEDDDDDNDQIPDKVDNCPTILNPGQENQDNDMFGDACDIDIDNDSKNNPEDNCPLVKNTDQGDVDGDQLGDVCDDDADGDGVANAKDNCPLIENKNQEDTDTDAIGDACDNDWDGDLVPNGVDNCPFVWNQQQMDTDKDGLGDACSSDLDGDGILDNADGKGKPGEDPCKSGQVVGCDDNCPLKPNPGQKNADGDAQGDECDSDDDNDGVDDAMDNCPLVANPPPGQTDADKDGAGDACDPDDDNDGVPDDGNVDGKPGTETLCSAGALVGCDDNCQYLANKNQEDLDGDGIGDDCDDDTDGDGVANGVDNCKQQPNPVDPDGMQPDSDGDGKGDACDFDNDEDGKPDAADNCPNNWNPDQKDNDGDQIGDACDPDDDGDGVPDVSDNCPATWNPGQVDTCKDGTGDACSPDLDCDGVLDAADNCVSVKNSKQEDNEGDGFGDVCDADDDNDTVADTKDNCPLVANLDQQDLDNDSKGNTCDDDLDGDGKANILDNCLEVANPDQLNNDSDGLGDACDPDDDNDGVADAQDNCPFAKNGQGEDPPDGNQANTDGDAKGNACDSDDDNDTILDTKDNCQYEPNKDQKDTNFNGVGDACEVDKDGDGVADISDNCVLKSNPDQTDTDGDGLGDACDDDMDGDGKANDKDNCPTETNADQSDEDADGKGDACDLDSDGDAIANELDNCPFVQNPGQTDTDGDGAGDACDTDDDNDTVLDKDDNCPTLPNPGQEDLDKDGVPGVDSGQGKEFGGDVCDIDDDGDGIPDAKDNCPLLFNNLQADLDGDGLGDECDADDDGDGIDFPPDNCPKDSNPGQEDSDKDGKGDACDNDMDNDGKVNDVDNCLQMPNLDQLDSDKDGFGDACDPDDDNDGIADESDNCPIAFNPDQQDESDKDGLGNACDPDDDNDGLLDAVDKCPMLPCIGETDSCQVDTDKDGLADPCDLDDDGDAIPDGKDNCPLAHNPDQMDADGDGPGDTCDPDDDNDLCPDVLDECGKYDPMVSCAQQHCNSGLAPEGACKGEICDGKDNDCNKIVDDPGIAAGCKVYYPDLDKDGYGAIGISLCLCEPNADYSVLVTGDCNDTNPNANPKTAEVCDKVDNNCNGSIDESAMDCTTYYKDGDNDGWGVSGDSKCMCQPEGTYKATKDGDCDDQIAGIWPGAAEVCDGKDNNCAAGVDEGNPGGGASCNFALPGQCGKGTLMCKAGALGCVQVNYPTSESCNGLDDDCDGSVDENLSKSCSNGCNSGSQSCIAGSWSVCNAPPPQCTSGLCCDGCKFKSSKTQCGVAPYATEEKCFAGCGGYIQTHSQYKYCTGGSADCGTGNLQWGSWTNKTKCGVDFRCNQYGNKASCYNCAPSFCSGGTCKSSYGVFYEYGNYGLPSWTHIYQAGCKDQPDGDEDSAESIRLYAATTTYMIVNDDPCSETWELRCWIRGSGSGPTSINTLGKLTPGANGGSWKCTNNCDSECSLNGAINSVHWVSGGAPW